MLMRMRMVLVSALQSNRVWMLLMPALLVVILVVVVRHGDSIMFCFVLFCSILLLLYRLLEDVTKTSVFPWVVSVIY
jgi:hypothetical protein